MDSWVQVREGERERERERERESERERIIIMPALNTNLCSPS